MTYTYLYLKKNTQIHIQIYWVHCRFTVNWTNDDDAFNGHFPRQPM